mgnify:CR=1 FL=1
MYLHFYVVICKKYKLTFMLENNIIISTKVKEKNERNVSDQIIQIAKENNGVVTTADIHRKGNSSWKYKNSFEFGKIRTNSTRCLYFAGNIGRMSL